MAQRAAMERSHAQANQPEPSQKQKHLGERLRAACWTRSKEQQQQHPQVLPLHSLSTSTSLLTAPPAVAFFSGREVAVAAAASAEAASVAAAATECGGSEARRGDGCSISRRTDPRRRPPVTGLEMIGRGLDESGSSSTSSTTAATTASSSSSIKSGAGMTSSWATRSKLPFHKLPFEVQQYHLAQRLHSSTSRRPSSAAAAAAAAAPPTEDEEDESAVVESAWFPLMPPAMAGEARQSKPLSPFQQRRVTGGVGAIVGPCGTATGCAAAGGWPREEGGPQGSERHWDTMEGTVVHLTAAFSRQGNYLPSTTTASTSSEASTSTSSSAGGSDAEGEDAGQGRRGQRQLPPLWASSCSSSSSTVVAAIASFSRRAAPDTAAAAATPATTEATAAGAAAIPPSTAHRRQHPPPPTAGLIDFDDRTPDAPRDHTTKALTLAALSGFVEGGGASTLQQVSLGLSNACRAHAPWSLRVTAGDDGTVEPRLPPQLADHLWPRSSIPARRRPTVPGFASGGGGREAGSGRLRRRRFITRVEIDGNHHHNGGGSVMSASWPVTMTRLEFGPRFNSPVEGVSLPDGVESIRFGAGFNQPVSRVRWPACLRELVFGNDFNQPVSGIGLPAGLRRLDFGGRFNFPVSAVDLPEQLRELRFGHGFNREIASVRWPPGLASLEFCGELQQRAEDVTLPQTLTHLALLGDFDQPIHAVRWPVRLTTVRFGDRFRQPVAFAAWPPSLKTLVVGRGYDMRLVQAGCGCSSDEGGVAEAGAGDAESFSSSGAEEADFLGERRRRGLPPFLRSLAAGAFCAQHGRAREYSRAVGLPAACEVMVRGCDEEGDGGCDAAVAVAAKEEQGARVQAEGRQHPATEVGAAEGDALVAGCEVLCLDGVTADGDERYSAWNDDDDEEEGGGLECEDIFGFEDGTWDMGDPWDPGSYPSGCGSGGNSSTSCSTTTTTSGMSY